MEEQLLTIRDTMDIVQILVLSLLAVFYLKEGIASKQNIYIVMGGILMALAIIWRI